MQEENKKEQQKVPEWQRKDEIRSYVIKLKQKYFSDLSHIEPDNMVYAAFSKKRSAKKAEIRSIKGVWKLFAPFAYILSVHLETWDQLSEQERYYVIYHELLHIPEEGFEQTSKDYQKLLRHDLEDFKSLVYEFGVYLEKIDRIVENGDAKAPEVDDDEDEEVEAPKKVKAKAKPKQEDEEEIETDEDEEDEE